MKVTIIEIVIGALGTVTKGLIKGLQELEKEDDWRPSKQLHYWDQPESSETSWRLERTCSHSNLCERPSANTDVKNLRSK